MKRNNAPFGLLIGLVMPMIGVLLFFIVKFRDAGLRGFLTSMYTNNKFGFMIISLSLLLNIIPFIYFSDKRRDTYQTAKGIVIATMLYAVLSILIRYVW